VTEPAFREDSLGYRVNHLARLLAHALAARIAPHGVVPGQFAQLLALFEEDGLTQRELCERVRIEQPTMANTLQRMERDGLIRRDPDMADRRRIRVHLTERARAIEPDLIAAARAVNATATEGLSDAEIERFQEVTKRLTRNLDVSDG
jgi:DNA-binding MarR family transcriptional regulator